MIVCSKLTYYRYSGLSTDEKPTKNIENGATFWETDSGKEFEWREDDWYPKPVPTISIPPIEVSEVEISNFPETQSVISPEYAYVMDDYSTPDIIYKGWAPIGSLEAAAVWRIQMMDMTAGIKKTWADGNTNFDNRWDQRLILDYS
jgi:hypothetical protein